MLTGYRKDRPVVLGQHTPISLARDRGYWKKIPFLKDNEGMLPPYMIVVGDRRRVLSAAMSLSEYILLHKEITKAGWDEEALFKSRIVHVLDQLRVIRKLAEKTALYVGVADYHYLTLVPDYSVLSKTIALTEKEGKTKRCWYTNINQLINELEWLVGPNGKVKMFSPFVLAGSLLMLSAHPPSVSGPNALQLHRIISNKLRYLADSVLGDAGRVNLAIGVFEYKGKPLPLTILETQMGCSAQDINAWEALINSREDGYMLGAAEVPGKGLVVIRAGTCGGIILSDGKGGQLEKPFIEVGDVINASYSFADGATVRQRMGSWSSLDPNDLRKFRTFWEISNEAYSERSKFKGAMAAITKDAVWPILYSSPNVVRTLSESARELGLTCHEGGNFTKESLYLESDEERLKDLRRKYGALSTEMEHFGLAYLTNELSQAGIPALNGLISTVVGTIPGGSFAKPGSKEEKKANESEKKMLEAAMRALWKIAYGD